MAENPLVENPVVRLRLEVAIHEDETGLRNIHAQAKFLQSNNSPDPVKLLRLNKVRFHRYMPEIDNEAVRLHLEQLFYELALYMGGPADLNGMLAPHIADHDLRKISDDPIASFQTGKFPPNIMLHTHTPDRWL